MKGKVVLTVGYQKFLMDVDDAKEVAARLALCPTLDREYGSDKDLELSFTLWHYGRDVEINLCRIPNEPIFKDEREARAEIKSRIEARRREWEQEQLALRPAEESLEIDPEAVMAESFTE